MVENAKQILTQDAQDVVEKIQKQKPFLKEDESSHLNFLLQYKAVLDCIYLVSDNECKKAH